MSSSHWCYRCNRFVSLSRLDIPMCPECDSGFVEQMEQPIRSIRVEPRRRRFSTAATTYMIGNQNSNNNSRRRNCRNNENDISQFNPIIMLRNNGTSEGTSNNRGVELFYEDRVGNGLRPLPRRMSELLLGSGFERIVEDLYNLEANRSGHERQHTMHLPALKSAVESLPSIKIDENHMITESHCAVCKEPFELGISAREMPCKHIYHPECILPWLAIRHSCPVCRHQLPREPYHDDDVGILLNEEENIGFTIWRLPGGEFAVGRFSGGRRGGGGGDGARDGNGGGGEGENEEEIIYNVGGPRRVSWSLSSSSTSTSRVNGGSFRRMLNSLIGCLRGGRVVGDDYPHSHSEESQDVLRTLRNNSESRNNANNNNNNNTTTTTTTTPSPRSRSRTWSMDVNSGTRPW